ALEHATLPYVLRMAKWGYHEALCRDEGFLKGLNVYYGQVTNDAVANNLKYEYISPKEALS
ncbi:MAG: alanine dehydrogenase, partial [Chlamydiota bacterium]|nr:alanine dehydrogenase [Chlamydiota bacterium]